MIMKCWELKCETNRCSMPDSIKDTQIEKGDTLFISLVKTDTVEIVFNNRNIVYLDGINRVPLEVDFWKIIPQWMTRSFGPDDISTLYEKVREILFEYLDSQKLP